MKVLVIGSRSINDYKMISNVLDGIIDGVSDVEIVSGGASGVDKLAEIYAELNSYSLKVFKADWDRNGKRAGYVRNAEMHKYISGFDERICVAFWDGKSKGTSHSFELAKRYGNPIKVIEMR